MKKSQMVDHGAQLIVLKAIDSLSFPFVMCYLYETLHCPKMMHQFEISPVIF